MLQVGSGGSSATANDRIGGGAARRAVDCFRERVDYAVENTVPAATKRSAQLRALAEAHADLAPGPRDQAVVQVYGGRRWDPSARSL